MEVFYKLCRVARSSKVHKTESVSAIMMSKSQLFTSIWELQVEISQECMNKM